MNRILGFAFGLFLLAFGQAQALDFVLATQTPAVAANFLINRGIAVADGQGSIVGVLPGFEFTATPVPSPIVTALGPPAVYDTTWKVFLIRFSANTDAADDDGTANPDPYARHKIVQWIMANSTAGSVTDATGKVWHYQQVGTGTTAVRFILPVDMAPFGAWQ